MINTKYSEIQFKKKTIIASEIIDIKMRHTHLLKSKPGELQIVLLQQSHTDFSTILVSQNGIKQRSSLHLYGKTRPNNNIPNHTKCA